ncbi:unnamed protein product [Penicillium glandicola]
MRFTPALLMLATAVGIATAAPSVNPLELSARSQETTEESVKVDICSEKHWEDCHSIEVQIQHECYSLEDTTVGSIKVPAGYRCRFWSSTQCNGNSTPDIGEPGAWDFREDMRGNQNSIKCYEGPIGSG